MPGAPLVKVSRPLGFNSASAMASTFLAVICTSDALPGITLLPPDEREVLGGCLKDTVGCNKIQPYWKASPFEGKAPLPRCQSTLIMRSAVCCMAPHLIWPLCCRHRSIRR